MGFVLLESYVKHLQAICYEDTTRALMSGISSPENGTEALTISGDDTPQIITLDDSSHDMPSSTGIVGGGGMTQQQRGRYERYRHVWAAQYPYVSEPLPEWLTHQLQCVQDELFVPTKDTTNTGIVHSRARPHSNIIVEKCFFRCRHEYGE